MEVQLSETLHKLHCLTLCSCTSLAVGSRKPLLNLIQFNWNVGTCILCEYLCASCVFLTRVRVSFNMTNYMLVTSTWTHTHTHTASSFSTFSPLASQLLCFVNIGSFSVPQTLKRTCRVALFLLIGKHYYSKLQNRRQRNKWCLF